MAGVGDERGRFDESGAMSRSRLFVSQRLAFVSACALAALGSWSGHTLPIAEAQSAGEVPSFAVDAAWPKPLPNNWTVGPVSGLATDAHDHIWLLHRREGVKAAGREAAPPVIEFDAAGAVVQTWGGPGAGYDWPQQVHGITVDAKDRVWISGNGDADSHILVFTRQGRFLRQIGRAGASGGSDDTANVARATQVRVDAGAGEVFVSDGEMNRHHRVIVFDSETGAYKRHWGAYGEEPDDRAAGVRRESAAPSRQFGTAVHCVRFDRGGLVYVCDRSNDRFQIFTKSGRFEREVFVARDSGAAGTVYDLAFSPDQRFVYVADGGNQKVWILRRDQMRVVGSFGERGQGAGQFATSLHDMTVDSTGNVYTGEAAAGGRVQKFAIKQGSRPR
jgi:DNA-binding beta-propeller fold protein YncE